MISKWIKSALRVLFKYRLYNGVSLIGLGVAISSFWFVANFFKNSQQYDTFHQNFNRIYRLTMEVSTGGSSDHYATTGKPFGSVLKENYSGISAYAKMTFLKNATVKVDDQILSETGLFDVNPGTLDVFTFKFLSGDRKTCFSSPNSILLSRFLAEKYFNSTDIVGKEMVVNERQYIVKGVFEDWPVNSHLEVSGLLYSEADVAGYELQDWFDLEQYNYVLLGPNINQTDLNNRLAQLTSDRLTPGLEGSGIAIKLHSQPLNNLYFELGLIDDVEIGNSKYVNTLVFSGLLVLLISGLNYINLSLTQSTKRLREISLKKILGISRFRLFLQSSGESLTMTLLALVISIVVVLIFDHKYFQRTGYHALDVTGNLPLLLIILLTTFVFGLLGTSYSEAHLSFSGSVLAKSGISVNRYKKILLGFQFAIATAIMIATLTINKQIDFMKNRDLGFSKDQIMIVNLPDNEELKSRKIQFREKVKNLTSVQNASLIGGGALPGEENGKDIFQVTIEGKKTEKVYNLYRIDENYCTVLGIKFALGRNFQADRLSDKQNAVIINQSLAKSFSWENPIGKIIWYGAQPKEGIGVVQDFHNKSLHNLLEPIVFVYVENYSLNRIVKTRRVDANSIKSVWVDLFPDTPFELTYFDQFIDAMYSKEDNLAKLLGFFCLVSLILSSTGLFAIFSLNVLQRTKEMCIRKVLGANGFNLIKTITKSYIFITLFAIGIAIPFAWYFMENWLTGFSYKIQQDPLISVLSAAILLFASCVALSYHVVTALKANPVDSLKYD